MINALLSTVVMGAKNAPTHIYPSAPVLRVFGADSEQTEMQVHGVTVHISKDSAKVETITLFRNRGATPVSATVEFRVNSNGYGFSGLKGFQATWDKKPVEFRVNRVDNRRAERQPSFRYVAEEIVTGHDVVMRPKSTGALTMSYTIPLGKTELDNSGRQFLYRMNELDKRPEQYRIALKYSPKTVYQVLKAVDHSRTGKWEWGTSGAYLKLDGREIKPGVAQFEFYPMAGL